MSLLRAEFDGKVFVPDEPPHLRTGARVVIEVVGNCAEDAGEADTIAGKPMHWRLIEMAEAAPDDAGLPEDFAAQADHYLYGTPKRDAP